MDVLGLVVPIGKMEENIEECLIEFADIRLIILAVGEEKDGIAKILLGNPAGLIALIDGGLNGHLIDGIVEESIGVLLGESENLCRGGGGVEELTVRCEGLGFEDQILLAIVPIVLTIENLHVFLELIPELIQHVEIVKVGTPFQSLVVGGAGGVHGVVDPLVHGTELAEFVSIGQVIDGVDHHLGNGRMALGLEELLIGHDELVVGNEVLHCRGVTEVLIVLGLGFGFIIAQQHEHCKLMNLGGFTMSLLQIGINVAIDTLDVLGVFVEIILIDSHGFIEDSLAGLIVPDGAIQRIGGFEESNVAIPKVTNELHEPTAILGHIDLENWPDVGLDLILGRHQIGQGACRLFGKFIILVQIVKV